MTGNVHFELCKSRADGIQRAAEFWKVEHRHGAEAWKVKHDQAMFVREVEDLIQACFEMPECLKRITTSGFQRMTANLIEDYQREGQKIQSHFDLALQAIDAVQTCVRIAEQDDYHVDGAKELENAGVELRVNRAKFDEKWPWIDTEMLENSMAAYERGESVTAKDWLDGLRNRNPKPGQG